MRGGGGEEEEGEEKEELADCWESLLFFYRCLEGSGREKERE